MSSPNVNEVQHLSDVRGTVAYVFDVTLTGNGFTGQYRPARPSDFSGGGGLITGIADSEQKNQIVGSGNINTAPIATVVDIGGIGALVTSGVNGGGGGSSSMVGITGTTGQVVALIDSGSFISLVTAAQGIRVSGHTGQMPMPVLVGSFINSDATGSFSDRILTSHQSDIYGNLWVSLGTALSNTVDSVAATQSGAWKVGITGTTGLGVEVKLVSGYNALPVFVISGELGGGGGSSVVGISGVTGQVVDVLDSGGFKGIVADVQGIRASGHTGTMPHPVAVGQFINTDATGTFPEHALIHNQGDTYGNLWVSLGTALSHIVDTIATRNQIPSSQGVYSFDVTGTGFSNYTGVVPSVTGFISMSMEPHSENTQPVYYAFSGGATTGNAWELRGDRTIEVAVNTGVFFASQSGTQRVMVHYQVF